MAKRPLQHKRGRNEGHPLGPRPPPNSLRAHAWDYLEALRVLQRTPAAVKGQAKALTAFMSWCEERGLLRSEDVTRPILERYQRHLFVNARRVPSAQRPRASAFAVSSAR